MNVATGIADQAESDRVCEWVIRFWKQGRDTVEIARLVGVSEPVVCRILHAWRDLRWQQRRATA